MRVYSPVTDYIRRSLLGTEGDLVVRGEDVPEVLSAGADGRVLTAQGAATIPIYKALFDLLTAKGDLWVQGATDPEALVAAAAKLYLKAKGATELPAYEALRLDDVGVVVGHITVPPVGDTTVVVGYRPSVVLLLAVLDYAENCVSIGFDNQVTHCCVYLRPDTHVWFFSADGSMYIIEDAVNHLLGFINAWTDTGFTIHPDVVAGNPYPEVVYLALP